MFFVVRMSYDLCIFGFMEFMSLEIKELLMCDDVGRYPEA